MWYFISLVESIQLLSLLAVFLIFTVSMMLRNLISFPYTWVLHGKNCPSWWCFLGNFWTGSKPSRRSISAAKKIRKGKVEKNKKPEKPRDVGHFLVQNQNFDLCACSGKNVVKFDASQKKGMLSCCKCLFQYLCFLCMACKYNISSLLVIRIWYQRDVQSISGGTDTKI